MRYADSASSASLFGLKELKHRRRPTVRLQGEESDCAYACIAALCESIDLVVHPILLRKRYGVPARGLRYSDAARVLRDCGAVPTVYAFNKQAGQGVEFPSILLIDGSHYVLAWRTLRGNRIEVLDPERGWCIFGYRRLLRRSSGIGIAASRGIGKEKRHDFGSFTPPKVGDLFPSRVGIREALGVSLSVAVTQIGSLVVPVALVGGPLSAAFNPNQTPAIGALLLFFALTAAMALMNVVAARVTTSITGRQGSGLLRKLGFSLASKSPEARDTASTRVWATRISTACSLQAKFAIAAISLVFACLAAAFSLAMLVHQSIGVAVSTAISLLLVIGLDHLLRVRARETFDRSTGAQNRYREALFDFSESAAMLGRFGSARVAVQRLSRLYRVNSAAQLGEVNIDAIKSGLTSLIVMADRLVFVVLCAGLVHSGELSVPAFLAVGLLRDQVRQGITRFVDFRRDVVVNATHLEAVGDLLKHQPVVTVSQRSTVPVGVQIENPALQYNAFDRAISFSGKIAISPGEVAVIVGASGEGKTSLLKALCGEVRLVGGLVEVGDPASGVGVASIGTYFGSDSLIADTIAENIRFFRKGISESSIYAALELVGLDDVVRSLPSGLGSSISNSRSYLSLGQRQRLLLARCFVAKSSLLVLDEPTSSLDEASEMKVIRAIKECGATVVVSSHRGAFCREFSSVYELSGGSICSVKR